jgi:hypothetical protein
MALVVMESRYWISTRGRSRASSISRAIQTSNLPFSRWGDVFNDHVVAAAMIDRIVHHADVLTPKGNSYRLRNTEINTLPAMRTDNTAD